RPETPARILLLRLERIGDLLMALPALADIRAFAPSAEIDLVVGSWNRDLAQAIGPVTRVLTLDAAWLAREGAGLGLPSLLRAARRWRAARYDLAINFEPDVRSNLLIAAAGARWTAGYASGGGGALLDVALEYDTRAHTTDNARRLVASVIDRKTSSGDRGPESGTRKSTVGRRPEAGPVGDQGSALGSPGASWTGGDFAIGRRVAGSPAAQPLLEIPADAQARASLLLENASGPVIGMHVSGGRAIKQWDPDRFAHVARGLIAARAATIVLTGSEGDRPIVDAVKRTLPAASVVDVAGRADLLTLAALLTRTDLLVTGDTCPMHLAVAVRTPVVAVFGPSDPVRYAPRGTTDLVVRIDLPCAPCNRIRLPPARCTGHTPDCLALVSTDRVLAAALSVLDASARCRDRPPGSARPGPVADGREFGTGGRGSAAEAEDTASRTSRA
ncbi:MAG: glycosyltransferase family 9 protein, partial [Acidobacteriota bacterium]